MTLFYIKRHLELLQPLMSRHYASEDRYMDHLEVIRSRFATLVREPEESLDLVEGALLIARTAFPDLISSTCTERLDHWADRLWQVLGPSPSVGDTLKGLIRVLFEEEGFRGDHQTYYDPQNSYLNRVLERKRGIPITLSLVYSEVGRRAGFPVHGFALPGHFIAGLVHASGTLYVDPFNGGELLTEKECRDMIIAHFGYTAAADAHWQAPVSKKTILKRMLRNLKEIYRHLNQDLQSFEMLQWILTLDPQAPDELKERGLLYETMGNNAFAVRDLERYLELFPDTPDFEVIKAKITFLRDEKKGWLH